jgi:hypothetical protein
MPDGQEVDMDALVKAYSAHQKVNARIGVEGEDFILFHEVFRTHGKVDMVNHLTTMSQPQRAVQPDTDNEG